MRSVLIPAVFLTLAGAVLAQPAPNPVAGLGYDVDYHGRAAAM